MGGLPQLMWGYNDIQWGLSAYQRDGDVWFCDMSRQACAGHDDKPWEPGVPYAEANPMLE